MNDLKEIIDDLDDEEMIVLYTIGSLNKPILTKTHLQKVLFLVINVFPEIDNLLDYKPYYYGPFSEEVEWILEDLLKQELVIEKDSKYLLSKLGKKLFKRLKPNEDLKNVINDFKEFLDVPLDFVLVFVYVFYPNYSIESRIRSQKMKRRIEAALYLLEHEKVSFSKALEISGLNILEFENLLKEKGIRWRYDNKDLG